jgi:streptomycin 3"-adenylyltransferase
VTDWGLEEPEREQLDGLVELLRDILRDTIVAVYLHGSAVLGRLRPYSDLDLMVVAARPTTAGEKRALIDGLLAHSTWPSQAGLRRSVEVTVVVASAVRPWRFPPRMDFQYGGWLRPAFEAGELEPWGAAANADLAPLLALTRQRGVALVGPPPEDVLDPVPHADLVEAALADLDRLLAGLEDDTRNIVLTLARIWRTLVAGDIVAKDDAADWALPQLPAGHREVLRRARAIYLGAEADRWDDLDDAPSAYGRYVAREIRRLTDPSTGP